MDMKAIVNILLEFFYICTGLFFANTGILTLKDKNHPSPLGSALFWFILAFTFIFGPYVPGAVTGICILVLGGLTATKQVKVGKIAVFTTESTRKHADQVGYKIFLPSVSIAVIALLIAQFTPLGGIAALGIASISGLILTLLITKAKVTYISEDTDRLVQSIGPTGILPQLLAALGALFTAAGVGNVISSGVSSIIPQNSILLGVSAYCIGMAVFTMIMGNSFAAFSVITAGIGIPFVFTQGANPAIAGALALTAGYCGTLLTPMAANFNIVPAALLETKSNYSIIKHQAPVAIILLVIHIALMYFLAF